MRVLWLVLTAFFSFFLQRSYAYGERGIAERAEYYIAYLAEEQLYELDETTKMTVAPGCVGSRQIKGLGKRCNFDELALYIWAPRSNGEYKKKPDGYRIEKTIKNKKEIEIVMDTSIKDLKNPDATSEFNKFIGDINQARFNTGESLNGEVDVGKLMPGKSDFYDALASMGDPIGALAAKVEKLEMASGPDETPRFRRTEEQGRVLKWGEKTAFYVSALRGKDQDHYRLKFFKKYFKKEFDDPKLEFEIKTKEVETPKQTKGDKAKGGGKKAEMKPEKVSLIDFDKTIESYREKIENFEERLMDANEKFMAIEKEMDGEKVKFNEAHKKAYIASRIATAATGCTRELPRDLRKRNPLAELSLRSPKAAKSMRVKARKLGFTT